MAEQEELDGLREALRRELAEQREEQVGLRSKSTRKDDDININMK